MTLKPKIKVTIGEYIFNFVHDCEVETGYENLTDTAVIELPRRIFLKKENGEKINVKQINLNTILKRFDKIKIEFGYKTIKEVIFEGFVSKINSDVPVLIYCEDAMMLLKETKVTDKSFKTLSLSELVSYLKTECQKSENENVRNINFKLVTEITNLGSFRFINNVTISEVLANLKQKNGVISYVINDTIFVGRPEKFNQTTAKFEYGFNVINNQKLEYWEENDIKIQMQLKAINEKGEHKSVIIGENNGQTITEIVYGNYTDNELKELGNQKIKSFKYTGYRGSFEAFFTPIVRHGDVIEYEDSVNNKPKGNFVAKAVIYRMGLQGFRQIITIGNKI
jgi:hypothetical protein